MKMDLEYFNFLGQMHDQSRDQEINARPFATMVVVMMIYIYSKRS